MTGMGRAVRCVQCFRALRSSDDGYSLCSICRLLGRYGDADDDHYGMS